MSITGRQNNPFYEQNLSKLSSPSYKGHGARDTPRVEQRKCRHFCGKEGRCYPRMKAESYPIFPTLRKIDNKNTSYRAKKVQTTGSQRGLGLQGSGLKAGFH